MGAYWKSSAEKEIRKMGRAPDKRRDLRRGRRGGALDEQQPRDAEGLPRDPFPHGLQRPLQRGRKQGGRGSRDRRIPRKLPQELQRAGRRREAEMRAAFGSGTTVCNIITGERIRLKPDRGNRKGGHRHVREEDQERRQRVLSGTDQNASGGRLAAE